MTVLMCVAAGSCKNRAPLVGNLQRVMSIWGSERIFKVGVLERRQWPSGCQERSDSDSNEQRYIVLETSETCDYIHIPKDPKPIH